MKDMHEVARQVAAQHERNEYLDKLAQEAAQERDIEAEMLADEDMYKAIVEDR